MARDSELAIGTLVTILSEKELKRRGLSGHLNIAWANHYENVPFRIRATRRFGPQMRYYLDLPNKAHASECSYKADWLDIVSEFIDD